MKGRSPRISARVEALTLAVCIILSLVMLFLPGGARITLANGLGAVITAPYWNARSYAEDVLTIRDENARLELQLTELELQAAAGDRMVRDGERMAGPALDPGFSGELVPCRVVMRQRSRLATMIKVRSLEPVNWRPWLPVVSRSGYLGRVRKVINRREAWVELLTSPDFAVGVEVDRNGLLGVLRPRGDRFAVEMIGRDEDVQEGDVIITSGVAEIRERSDDPDLSVSTPRGFPVGVVVATASPSDKIFKEIIVQVGASFDRNETVFVVTRPDAGGGF